MPEADFEKTFADLAHARLRDRAPGMLDHLVGFQLLEKSEDDTHAVGVWGFKIGNEWMYAPVFFLNGQLKGDELLYLKSQDSFVPLKENWINYLLNRRPHILGEPEELKPNELGMKHPDFNVLTRPPHSGSKYAKAGDLRNLTDYLNEAVHDDFKDFIPVIVSPPNGGKRAALNDRMSVTGFIRRAGKKAATMLIQTMRKHADFADAILTFYSMEDIIKAAEYAFAPKEAKDYPVNHPYLNDRVKIVTGKSKGKTGVITSVHKTETQLDDQEDDGTKVEKRRTDYNVIVTLTDGTLFPTSNPSEDLVDYSESDKAVTAKEAATGDKKIEGTAPRVTVMLADRANVNDLGTAMLSDNEKEQLQRDRYLVKDRRGDNQVASVYHRQIGKTLQNPAFSGYCRMLLSTGSFSPMLIILSPHGDPGRTDGDKGQAVIVNLEKGNRIRCVHPKQLFVDNEGHAVEAWEKRFNALPESSAAREKDKVIFVNAKCEGSVPFFIRRRIVSEDGQTMLYGDFDRHPYTVDPEKTRKLLYPKARGRVFNPSDAHSRYDSDGSGLTVGRAYGYDHCFIITGKDGKKITQIGNDHFVPNGFKMIRVNPKDIESWTLREYARERKGETINGVKLPPRVPDGEELASPQTLADIEMQLFKSGMLTVMQPITDGIQFWLSIGGQPGPTMSKIAAIKDLVVRHNLREKDALFLLKQARKTDVPEFIIKQAQQPSMPAIPEPQIGYEAGLNVPVIYPQTELIPSDTALPSRGEEMYDMDATFRAQQAAATGQKEVLDTSVVSGLVKTMDPEAAIDSYIGDLMLSLDRIGRILFMYYWHYEKFKERYGAQDMPELEDNLKNVFDNLGDLTLFLKQKTIEPEVTGATAEAELSEVM